MYDILKKLLPVAEEIGTVITVHQNVRDQKFFTSDEIRIEGTTPNGRKFTLKLALADEEKEDAS